MTSLRNQGTINLVVAHREDAAAQLAVARVADLVKSGAVDPFCTSGLMATRPCHKPQLLAVTKTLRTLLRCSLRFEKLDRVRIVGLFCPSAGVDHASELDHSVRAIVDVINETKGAATEVAEIRVQATSADAPQVARAAFSGLALANIVLIPHDRRSDVAAARFVESAQTDRIAAHIAVELCSMLGAWSSMKGSFLDDWAYTPPSGDGPSIVFLRSVVRSLICPPLPVDRIVEEGSVPMPQGFLPSPNPEATVRAVADAVFPDELRFHANQAPTRREEIPLGEALRKVPKRSGRPCAAFRECFVTGSPGTSKACKAMGYKTSSVARRPGCTSTTGTVKPIRMPGRGLSRRETRSMISKRATKCLPSSAYLMTCGSALLNFPSQ